MIPNPDDESKRLSGFIVKPNRRENRLIQYGVWKWRQRTNFSLLAMLQLLAGAKNLFHHFNQFQRSCVIDTVVDPICLFSAGKNPFIAQNCEVLGDIALRSAYLFYYFLHTDRLASKCAKNF